MAADRMPALAYAVRDLASKPGRLGHLLDVQPGSPHAQPGSRRSCRYSGHAPIWRARAGDRPCVADREPSPHLRPSTGSSVRVQWSEMNAPLASHQVTRHDPRRCAPSRAASPRSRAYGPIGAQFLEMPGSPPRDPRTLGAIRSTPMHPARALAAGVPAGTLAAFQPESHVEPPCAHSARARRPPGSLDMARPPADAPAHVEAPGRVPSGRQPPRSCRLAELGYVVLSRQPGIILGRRATQRTRSRVVNLIAHRRSRTLGATCTRAGRNFVTSDASAQGGAGVRATCGVARPLTGARWLRSRL